MLLTTMDQLAEASYQLKQSMKSALPGNLLPPKEQDSYNLDLSFKEFLRSLDLCSLSPLFPPVVLDQPDLDPLL